MWEFTPVFKQSLTLDATCSHDRCQGAGTYTLIGHCANCGARQVTGTFTRGHDADNRSLCPRCQCRHVYWDRGVQ